MNEENKIPLPGAMDPQPQKPDFLQGDDWFETQVDDDFLDFDEPYRPPRYTMERDGCRSQMSVSCTSSQVSLATEDGTDVATGGGDTWAGSLATPWHERSHREG